jgi:hypothetical protein
MEKTPEAEKAELKLRGANKPGLRVMRVWRAETRMDNAENTRLKPAHVE